MGKRSDFKRRPQDAYDTPPQAVAPLIPHLPDRCTFVEPCAGAGDLMRALERAGMRCAGAIDIYPRSDGIRQKCALSARSLLCDGNYIITNPPWTRPILHQMIEHFSALRPTWLLFDADWMHTRQSAPHMKLCRKIVSVGRVKWIKDSPHTGKDNAAWHLFDARTTGPTEFVGRTV